MCGCFSPKTFMVLLDGLNNKVIFMVNIVFLIITRFTMSIEDSRKNMKIIFEESRWKILHHKLHKNIFDLIMSKLTLSFIIWFEDLLLQLISMGMMHMLEIFKTYSKFYLAFNYLFSVNTSHKHLQSLSILTHKRTLSEQAILYFSNIYSSLHLRSIL
jgi:hypothetical protein